jgi:hypothetical protein
MSIIYEVVIGKNVLYGSLYEKEAQEYAANKMRQGKDVKVVPSTQEDKKQKR